MFKPQISSLQECSFTNMGTFETVGRNYSDPSDFVSALQANLWASGYSNTVGYIDGSFGPKTEQAVIYFQQRYGLQADGIAGSQTWGKMNDFYYYIDPYERHYNHPSSSVYHVRYTYSISSDIHAYLTNSSGRDERGPWWLWKDSTLYGSKEAKPNFETEKINISDIKDIDFKLPTLSQLPDSNSNIDVLKSKSPSGNTILGVNYHNIQEQMGILPKEDPKGLLYYYQVEMADSQDKELQRIQSEYEQSKKIQVNGKNALLVERKQGTDLLYILDDAYKYIFVTYGLNEEKILDIGKTIHP